MQLTIGRAGLGLALVAVLAPAAARADGTVSVRGAYYKESSTRVEQPMIDASLDAGEHGTVDVHALVDSITSASAAAGSSDGSAFTERRLEIGAGYRHAFDRVRVGGGLRTSTESDYSSVFGHARVELDLADRNAVVALVAALGHDEVSNAGAQGMTTQSVRGTLDTTMLSASLTQVLGETVVAAVGYDVVRLGGFQENAYRLVPAAGELELERVPDRRLRHAAVASARGYLPATGTTLIAAYRVYHDDWGIWAHTPEARAIQELVRGLDLALGYRYYRQNAADFYRTVYDSADPAIEPYLTADVKLSRMHSHSFSGKLAVTLGLLGFRGAMAAARADVVVDYVRPSTYLGPAVIAELGLTVPLSTRLGALLALGAALAACGGDETCGPGAAAADGIAFDVAGTEIRFEDFTSSANNDCTSGATTSLTVVGHQQGAPDHALVLCLPAPDRLGGDPIALDDASLIQIIDVFVELDGCSAAFDRDGAAGGTARFGGLCAAGSDPAGYSLALEGTLPLVRTCGDVLEALEATVAGAASVVAD